MMKARVDAGAFANCVRRASSMRGCMMASTSARSAASAKIARPSAARSIEPSGRATPRPARAITAARTSGISSTARATSSETQTSQPSARNAAATALLPLPMPPQIPMTGRNACTGAA